MNPKNIFYTLLVCLGLIKSGKPDVKRETKDKKKKKENRKKESTTNKLSDDFTKTKMKLDHSFLKIPQCQF